MHRRAAWVVAITSAALAWGAPVAGAAPQVEGTLQVTQVTASDVSISVTTQRTCVAGEQCDLFAEVDQLPDDAGCPTTRPADPWIFWTGDVHTAGPATEANTATPRQWTSKDDVKPSRLCLYVYADGGYTLVGDEVITRPARPAGPGTGGGGTGGTGGQSPSGSAPKPGSSGGTPTSGASSPTGKGCGRFTYQQSAQKALDADRSLAATLDRNGDGVACQGLPKRKTYVKTLATRASATYTAAALRRAYGASFAKRANYAARCSRLTRTRVRCRVAWTTKASAYAGYVDVVGVIRRNQQAVLTHVHVTRGRG